MNAFVGREDELRRGASALDAALGGAGQTLLLAGDAGIGKTALARALAREAAGRGFATIESRAWDGADAPAYWPFIQVFRALLRDRGDVARAALDGAPGRAAKVAELAPEIASSRGGEAADRFALFDAAAGWLRDVAREVPLFVFFDDLHLADPSSLSMLQLVAREAASARVVIVATYRDRGVASEVLDRLARIGRDATVMRIGRLDRDHVMRMIEAAKGAAPPAIAEMVYRSSEGVPLFVEELLRSMSAPGAALLSGAPLPVGVRSVIRDRLARLDDDTQRCLEAASVVGRTFTLALVQILASDTPAERVHELVERAAQQEAVERVAPGRYAFTQAMIREALYREIPGGARAKLHAAIVTALEQGRAQASAFERAQHALRAAPVIGVERAVAAAEEAAAAAVAVHATEDATELLRRALTVLGNIHVTSGNMDVTTLRDRVFKALSRVEARELPAQSPPPSAARATLEREGELWIARFGGALVRLKDSRGLQMLATLLERPGEEVHALTLSGAAEGTPAGDSGEVLDREAIDAYRERLVEVEEELREAEAWNDAGRAERAKTEMDLLKSELSRAVGLGGRMRRAGADAERARINAQRRLKDAIRRIAEQSPDAGRHLERTVRTGTFCAYEPERA